MACNVSQMGAVLPQISHHFKLCAISPLVGNTQNGIASLCELFAVGTMPTIVFLSAADLSFCFLRAVQARAWMRVISKTRKLKAFSTLFPIEYLRIPIITYLPNPSEQI
jgi:hypothetical protein